VAVAQRLYAQPLPLTVTLPAGHTVTRQGDPCFRAWIVKSGALMERMVSLDGRVLIPRLPGPGDLIGGTDGGPSPVRVTTIRRTTLRPAVGRDLTEGLAARARQAHAFVAEIAWLDTITTIELRLRQIAERFGRAAPGGTAVGLTLTQEELGAFAGTTRESANRAVGELMRRGTILRLSRGRYLVRAQLRSVDR
jgi:CRP/FNR family transcriptional regulator, cyclic AMP receptor protein